MQKMVSAFRVSSEQSNGVHPNPHETLPSTLTCQRQHDIQLEHLPLNDLYTRTLPRRRDLRSDCMDTVQSSCQNEVFVGCKRGKSI